MLKKSIVIILILLLIPLNLTGCYDAYSVEKLAYVVALGLDKGENNALKLTLQFATNTSESSSGGSSQSEDSSYTSIECASIDSGITMINSYISKKVNLSHCKAVIFSEEIAQEGLKKYLNTMSNSIELRPDCNVVVSRCSAADFISNSHPTLTNLTARYYEVLLNSKEYTGYTIESHLWKVFDSLEAPYIQPVTILSGLNIPSTHKKDDDTNYIELDYSYKADETPIENPTKIQNLGMAVFKEDKLVGEMNTIECICYLILTNKLRETTISIPSPFEPEESISLYLSLSKNTQLDVKLVNHTPYITCKPYLEVSIQSLGINSDYSQEENLKIIEEYTSSYMKSQLMQFLYKTSKEFKSDIVGFGKKMVGKYLTTQEWRDSDWLKNYKNSFFDVEVYTNVKGSYLFMKH